MACVLSSKLRKGALNGGERSKLVFPARSHTRSSLLCGMHGEWCYVVEPFLIFSIPMGGRKEACNIALLNVHARSSDIRPFSIMNINQRLGIHT